MRCYASQRGIIGGDIMKDSLRPGTIFTRRLTDRKSTRLNSSHMSISYAVFCLKKKKKNTNTTNMHIKKVKNIKTIATIDEEYSKNNENGRRQTHIPTIS